MRKNLMTNEENRNEERKETTEAKILNNKLEELRRWFESVGDCV
tara:strand:- start:293 stop:424 length:132 start_codon:yes stop_codon:yes gene_type:complete